MVLRYVAAAVLLTGCIHRPPEVRLVTPVPIAVAYVADSLEANSTEVSPELIAAVNEVLVSRNLEPHAIPSEQYAARFADLSTTPQRLAQISALSGDAPLVLLIEVKPIFFDFMEGRFKWSVHERATMAKRDNLLGALTQDFDDSVFLGYDREKELAAQSAAADSLALRTSRFLDTYFGGRPDFPTEPVAAPRK